MTPTTDNAHPNTITLSRREFLARAGGVVAGAALAACTGQGSVLSPRAASPRRDKAQLVYQDWRTDWFPPMAQQLLEEFHASHPNIRVFYTLDPPSEVYGEKMMADFQAGAAADVFSGCCSYFPIWAQKQATLDLSPYVKADLDPATIQDWDPAQYKSYFTRDGRQYALPKYHGALALYYNRDLFDRYGVDYPDETWNHDDYLAAMKRLTLDEDGDGQIERWGSMLDVSWDRLQVHVNGWGGHFADPANPTRCLMDQPEALNALEWIRARMWDDHVMPTRLAIKNLDTRDAFVSGKLAMVEDGSWSLKAILSAANFRVGVAPFPAGPVRRATLATTDGFAIYAGTRHPDAAWDLVKFLISKDCGRAMARAHLLQPARASLVDEWSGFIRAEFPDQTRDMNIAAFADGHLKGYSVIAESFPNMADSQQIASDAWEQVLQLGQGGMDIIRAASRQIEAAQQRG